jgi:transcriptional regulator with XRE-family HTH domain
MPTPKRPRDHGPSRTYRASARYKAEAKAIGMRVRKLRHARGLSLYQASEAMDVELRHLQRLETGVLNVTLATLLRVAEGLGVPACMLLGGPWPEQLPALVLKSLETAGDGEGR